MYSTSPSTSSMASSSGRSSPEHNSQSHKQQPRRSNSFLLPQLFFSSSSSSSSASTNTETPHPFTNALASQQPPRRTSFGSGLTNSGRFSALSAFGFMSSGTGFSSSPPASLASAADLSRLSGSAVVESPASESLPSSSITMVQQNGNASTTAPAPPAKRHLCMPDGMGGTVCLEIKDRSRRGSSVI
ncbi:uncharacterized protein MEPE_00223 [Melanopsichium pennsylvanicum]|uniref:Uncharacterized protein n=2 Tax=Melanopsichium pennsylvanicum TaxID=63383 RepID=A0AAJ4XHY7_9BASI